MSHEIVYDRRFIRTPKGYVPMILSGSNNCTEPAWGKNGRVYERRERHWWAFTPRRHEGPLITEEKYLEYIQACNEEREPGELFVQNGKWVYTNQWAAWVKRGCRDAKTLEEYLQMNPTTSFWAEIRVCDSENDWPGARRLGKYFGTSDELVQWIDEAFKEKSRIIAEATDPKTSVSFELRFMGKEPLKVTPAIEGPVIVRCKNGYLKDYDCGKRISFSPVITEAIVFESIEDAQSKIGRNWKNLRFTKVPKDMMDRIYVIKIASGYRAGSYIGRKTRSTLDCPRGVETAQRFSSVKAAERYIDKTIPRFKRLGMDFEIRSVNDPGFCHAYSVAAPEVV